MHPDTVHRLAVVEDILAAIVVAVDARGPAPVRHRPPEADVQLPGPRFPPHGRGRQSREEDAGLVALTFR